jgi:hypothetical protein
MAGGICSLLAYIACVCVYIHTRVCIYIACVCVYTHTPPHDSSFLLIIKHTGRGCLIWLQPYQCKQVCWQGNKCLYKILTTPCTTRIQGFCERAKQVTKYGFTLTKIMREGTPSRINSHDNRHMKYTFSWVHRHGFFFVAGVRDGHSHENNVATRFASVFSWRFFVVFRESSPSRMNFVRVWYFRESLVFSWEFTFTNEFRENLVFREILVKLVVGDSALNVISAYAP